MRILTQNVQNMKVCGRTNENSDQIVYLFVVDTDNFSIQGPKMCYKLRLTIF